MSHELKLEYMTNTVMPRMREVFSAFDPHRYRRMGCVPCHARDSKGLSWKMPNGDLPIDTACGGNALELGSAPSEGAHAHTSAAMSEMDGFMLRDVGPEMARLLGVPAYDPIARRGFGCFGCHTRDR